MLRNYFIIAFRNLWHNKIYALINILGLAIGLTAALFIFQYVQFEKSYDNFHENADNIYRLIIQPTINGVQESPQHNTPPAFALLAKSDCPEVLAYARLFQPREANVIISYHAEDGTPPLMYLEEKFYYADASFLQMFSFPMRVGTAKTLQEPNTLLLSESMAQKLFGANWMAVDPIGKRVMIDGNPEFVVQGVFKDIPENSHIKFEVLASFKALSDFDTRWNLVVPIYLQIDPNADIKKLEDKLEKLMYKYAGDFLKRHNITSWLTTLQPIQATHLYSFGYSREPEIRGSQTTVQFLFIAAFFILILAWINYVNLSTARAVKRAKEVGIRKVVGAGRRQLIMQFLLEAFLINLLSLGMAVTMYQLCTPFFIHLVQHEISLNALIEETYLLIGITLMLVLGTLLSGGYSAFVLSSFKTVSMMKGKFHTSLQGVLLRKGLIVFQFIISVGLIAGTFTVYQQLLFMKNQEMGYNISQKLIVRAPKITHENYAHHYESFKISLQKLPGIGRFTGSYLAPGDPQVKGTLFVLNKKQPEIQQVFSINTVDEDYLDTYQLKLLHGRGFSKDFPTDRDAVVITEEVALQMGFEPVETALHEKIIISNPIGKEFNIIGIVKNLNLYSLKLEQRGLVFLLKQDQQEEGTVNYQQFNYFTIEVDNLSHLQKNIASIETLYKSLFPGNPFNYFFLDDYFNAQYKAEEQFGKVFTAASGLAIFIACLGLFGLSAFMIKQRTKEIGIRKVLGAPVQSILLLLSSDYIKLIGIAGIIALPFAYWSLNRWLESYMVRISLSWWLFFIPVAIVISIALVTVSFQTIKAALTNPAKSLRYE